MPCGFDAACGELLVHYYQNSLTMDQDERALQLLKDIRAGSFPRVDLHDESIHDKVTALGGYISDGIPIRIHRIYVRPGEEVSIINELHHF